MKNLSKVLSLVLALAMIVGIFTIGASAAFTDGEDISYDEAVDVLAVVKALEGYTDGSFNPEGEVTRAEAAVIIARILLGRTLADALVTDAAPFSDVAATNWAAGEIAYCVEQGIVAGIGDGKFDPNGKVTGYQFAKLLLVAIGFDAAENGLTGANWQINTAKLAIENGLFAGNLGADYTKNATREEASLYAFNALQYSKTGATTYTVDGSNIVFTDLTTALLAAGGNVAKVTANTPKDTLAAKLGLVRVSPVTAPNGLTGHKWQIDSKDVTVVYADDTYVASFAAGTTYAALVKGVGITKDNTKTAQWYANGVAKGAVITAATLNGYLVDTNPANVIPAPVDVYVDANGNYKLMATIDYLAKVKSVTPLTGLDAGLEQVVFTVYAASNYDVTYSATYEIAKGTYKVDELYVVVPAGDNVATAQANGFLSIAKPGVVEGKVTGTGTGYVRIDGTKYTLHPLCEAFASLDYNTSTFTFYTDANGYVIGYAAKTAAPAVAFDGIVYLTKAEAQVTGAASSLYGDTAYGASAKAAVYFAGEAALKTIDLAVYTEYNADGTYKATYVGKNTSGWDITTGYTLPTEITGKAGWYGYNVTDAGYVLTAIADSKAADVSLKANSAAVIAGKYADADTVVTVYNYDAVAKNTTKTVYTGIAGYPAVAKAYTDAANLIVVTYAKNAAGADTNKVATIDIYGNVNSTTAVTYAYYKGAGETYATGKQYQGFYINGEYVEYKVADSITLNAGEVYNLTINADGVITARSSNLLNATAGTVVYVGASYVTIKWSAEYVYYYSSAFAAYDVTTAGAGAVATLAVGDTVNMIYDTTTYVVSAAYITAHAA